MSQFYDLASLVVIPSGYKASTIYAQKPLTTDGQLSFSRASTATRVNASGLIEAVASNVPRLDYLGSSCPRLLLEPQRVNYQLNSQVFSNWYAPNDGVTLTDNTTDTLDPAGTNTAEKVTTTGGNQRIYDIVSIPAGSSTYSVFVKAGTGNLVQLFSSNVAFSVVFNLSTQSVTATIGSGTIKSYGNGWYRCTATGTTPNGDVIQILFPNSVGQTTYIWGAQWEAGAYDTSYIPTTSAAVVTRVADACFKTGISSLLNSTQGSFYIEVERIGPSGATFENLLFVSDTSVNNFVNIIFDPSTSRYRGSVRESGVTTGLVIATAAYTGTIKIAIAYAANDLVLYINGVQQAVDTSVTIPSATFNSLGLGGVYDGTTFDTFNGNYKQVLLFKTRLTNAQLAELTAL
jgi:hypothetical protein